MGSPPEGRSGHTCLSPGGSALPVLHSQLLEKQPPSQVVVVTRKVTLATGGVCRGREGTFLGNQLQASWLPSRRVRREPPPGALPHGWPSSRPPPRDPSSPLHSSRALSPARPGQALKGVREPTNPSKEGATRGGGEARGWRGCPGLAAQGAGGRTGAPEGWAVLRVRESLQPALGGGGSEL